MNDPTYSDSSKGGDEPPNMLTKEPWSPHCILRAPLDLASPSSALSGCRETPSGGWMALPASSSCARLFEPACSHAAH